MVINVEINIRRTADILKLFLFDYINIKQQKENRKKMKILLIGEYSNVHNTLAQGLRTLGHKVVVMSNGDFWKNYPRDINVARSEGKIGGIALLAKIITILPRLRGFDVVQFINPMFLELKAQRLFAIFDYLKRNNAKTVMGAFGMDYYWVHENRTRKPLRYGDFNIGETLRDTDDTRREIADWTGTDKQRLNEKMADECDNIVAGLYEYMACYKPLFPKKTSFIPFPIVCSDEKIDFHRMEEPIKIFVGINKSRSAYKGTDIMLKAAQDVAKRYPEKLKLKIVESVPFEEYRRLMMESDAIIDQLYSYTPSMNPLEAMSHGLICIGGGEPENYDILGEKELHPIVNVEPTYESVYHEIEQLIMHPERIGIMQRQSIEYIRRHHDHIKVAKQYEHIYMEKV